MKLAVSADLGIVFVSAHVSCANAAGLIFSMIGLINQILLQLGDPLQSLLR